MAGKTKRFGGGIFFHGSDKHFEFFQPGEAGVHMLGKGVYFFKDQNAARRHGNIVYKVSIPRALNIAMLDFRLTDADVKAIFEKDIPDMIGIYNPAWWALDGWRVTGWERFSTIEKVAQYMQNHYNFDGMLISYPNGGLGLVVWRNYTSLRPIEI